MRFFIADDDVSVRYMLTEIIEDYNLGEVVGEAENGAQVSAQTLVAKEVSILIIDFLMPQRDGMQTVAALKGEFDGKIVMLSQVENKEMVGRAYEVGVDYYITKPINRNEVVGVLRTVSEHIRLGRFARAVESGLSSALQTQRAQSQPLRDARRTVLDAGQHLLSEMGVGGEMGCRDLLAVLEELTAYKTPVEGEGKFPALKDMFDRVAAARSADGAEHEIRKESKALEQRLRRTIFQALVNLASIGVVDYAHPKFEEYAAKFFDFAEIRKIMAILERNEKPQMSQAHINVKKFVRVLWLEAQKAAAH